MYAETPKDLTNDPLELLNESIKVVGCEAQ